MKIFFLKKVYTLALVIGLIIVIIGSIISPIIPAGVTVNVPYGATVKTVSKYMAKHTVLPAWVLNITGRLFFLSTHIIRQKTSLKAGIYTLDTPQTVWGIWRTLNDQLPKMVEVKLLEGWTFKQIRTAINQHPDLKHDTVNLDDRALMQGLHAADIHPEGQFFPDTYQVARQSSDWVVYKLAFDRMRKLSAKVWRTKPSNSLLKSIDELINLASIIEKETALDSERNLIASVFHNRLNLGMRLQTDPTVIYGMGTHYQGNLRKIDLQRDTPYNTYTRKGLPPTPIAAPSEASLWAAINPIKTQFIYFVAKGDGSGSSQFSETLNQHNRAVADYLNRLIK